MCDKIYHTQKFGSMLLRTLFGPMETTWNIPLFQIIKYK